MSREKNNPFQSGPSDRQVNLLANWLNVIAAFHSLHAQLSDCLAASSHSLTSSSETTQWIGQCPVGQVKALVATMRSELETMLDDANQLEHLTRQEGYEQLASHVDHVSQLNQQAMTLLCLASLPTG